MIRHPKPDDMMDFDFIRCGRIIKMHAPSPQSALLASCRGDQLVGGGGG